VTQRLDMPVYLWGVGVGLFGAVSGLLFTAFVGKDRTEARVIISAIGVVTFASGVGVALGASPLVVNLIAGMFVAFTSPDARVLERTMVRLRHPVLVLIRLFAGAAWLAPPRAVLWVVPPLYALVRILVRRITTYPLTLMFDWSSVRLPRLGSALVGQGGLAVAIGLSYALQVPEHAGVVLTTVIGGVILADLWTHRAVRRVLADAGEIDVIPVEQSPSLGGDPGAPSGGRL
jgi:Kef-type K+ transport system membrane component KefB